MATAEAEDVPLEECHAEDNVKEEWAEEELSEEDLNEEDQELPEDDQPGEEQPVEEQIGTEIKEELAENEEEMKEEVKEEEEEDNMESKEECKVQMKPIEDEPAYDDVEEEHEEIEYQEEAENQYDEVQGEEDDQYEEEYVEEDGDEIYEEEEDEEEQHVQIHDEEDVINFDDSQEDVINFEDDDEDEAKEAVEEQTGEEFSKLKVTEEVEAEVKEEEKEEVYPEEEQLTAEEKHIEFIALDALQRAIDEERYSLRKLRTVVSYQSEDIERVRRRITEYTKDAQDSKAIEYMEKLKVLKKEREKAVEERKVANDGLAVIKNQREDKILELKKKGIRIDTRRSAYMIENTALKDLMTETRLVLTKYNSFAVLKYSFEELDDVIHHVSNVCDDIDSFLIKEDLRPHYVSKLNTKERRVGVLFDKLIKWKSYKVENPDIRPTDYESFLYDPEDPFSADESEPEKRESAPRAIRSVRGDTPPRRAERKEGSVSSRSPIRAPVRTSPSPSRPAARPARSSPPPRTTLVRRSIRGSITESSSTRPVESRPMVRDRPLRAERGGDSPPRRAPVGVKRGPPPHRSPPGDNKRPASNHSRPPMRIETREPRRPSPPRRERPIVTSRPRERPLSGPRSDDRRERPALLTTPPVRTKPRENSYERRQRMRRSPSPGAASYRGRERENFQISVKNEGYKRDSFEERPVRREERGDVRPRGSATRRPEMSSRPERPVISSRKDTYREAREQRPVVRSTSPQPTRRSEIGGSRGHSTSYRGSSMSTYRPRR